MKIMQITRDALIDFIDTGKKFTLVDVLPRDNFRKEHIPGALSLPVDEIESSAEKVLPDKHAAIITYCASFDCAASTKAAEMLVNKGYTDVLDFKGGIKDFKTSGRKLEGEWHKAGKTGETKTASCCAMGTCDCG